MSVLKNVQSVMVKFNNDPQLISKELKRVQSVKCRLKKQKARKDYDTLMKQTLVEEQVLKEARSTLIPKKKFVTDYTQEDVNQLNYDETIKSIKSIQSKKCLTKLEDDDPNENEEYKKSCQIEKMLLNHKKEIRPLDETVVRKTDVQTIIDTLQNSGKLNKDSVIELLQKLM